MKTKEIDALLDKYDKQFEREEMEGDMKDE